MSEAPCPFCAPPAERIFHAGPLTLGLWDGFAVSPGHALLVPKRHVASWFDASREERSELLLAVDVARAEVERLHAPQGFNIGVNVGAAAGQTVMHLHVHLIPRYAGDVADPRGGVRYVIPAKANYLTERPAVGDLALDREAVAADAKATAPLDLDLPALVTGDGDPLLPHLRAALDRCIAADWAVAFVLESGVKLLRAHWLDLLERGGRFRLVTGSYLGVTAPDALLALLDLAEQFPQQVELFVFEADGQSFHPKAFLFGERDGGGAAWVGSSNLTRTALEDGVEWNFRTVPQRDRLGLAAARRAFETLLQHPRVRVLDMDWVEQYRQRRTPQGERLGVPAEAPEPPPRPHAVQELALRALEATRAAGNSAGLVVLATGLGKTWLSAFDSERPEFRRVLFVAHREEILRQAMATYRRIRPRAHLGLFTGQEKTPGADVVFASVQTLGRREHLQRFSPRAFDYIVMDEFHHAAARTYRRVLDHFEPHFLLGLTATPERTDGGDLLALCQENLVFRCDLAEGIRRELLTPFRYFGVPDEVDYAQIPWRSSRFDEEALTRAVATRTRAQNALEQHRLRAGARTLAFCCSTRHADFMREFFREAGLRAAAVHSGESSDARAASLEALEAGELAVVFAVDMFNEGVDLPHVDTVMMLRPTESRLLWLQQLGRGLRRAEGKRQLTVIDYIGNHRTFLLKPQTLFELPPGDAVLARTLDLLQQGRAELPPGCEVTYELEAIDILRSLLRQHRDADLVRFAYEDFRERHGQRPTAVEMHHEGYSPGSLRKGYGSWLRFVDAMGDLDEREAALVRDGRTADFLASLETTPMTRSYKMLVLLAMLSAGCFPGEMTLAELVESVRRLARRSGRIQADLSVPLDGDGALERLLEENPIAAWTGSKGRRGTAYFSYDEGRFAFTLDVAPELRETLAELTREIAEWRLAQYLDREGAPAAVVATTAASPLELGKAYLRPEIPAAFGLEFKSMQWQQGFVTAGGQIFLLVTLDKTGMPAEHRYGDRFLSRDRFEWKSQNRTSQASRAGQDIRHHRERGLPVHLLVRKSAKLAGSKAAPFVYCGELDFESWEGEKPISVVWRLRTPLSERVAELFGVDGAPSS